MNNEPTKLYEVEVLFKSGATIKFPALRFDVIKESGGKTYEWNQPDNPTTKVLTFDPNEVAAVISRPITK